ncbi:hypothetical protein [Micromonospora sp. MH33]|uniref:hypothetical protein n=1 Tax=Micromonospora sp. MH33 TaxID=1945509 RepID=UPI000D14AE8F|nr:hypothetical protein [Micromonospora sp. MH33]
MLNNPAFLQQLGTASNLLHSPLIENWAKVTVDLPTAQIRTRLAAIQGYPLQNLTGISSAVANWEKISASLRRLVADIAPS